MPSDSADFEKRLAFIRGNLLRQLQARKLEDKIFEMIQDAYNEALLVEGVVLSGFEQKRMLQAILSEVLEGVIKKAQ